MQTILLVLDKSNKEIYFKNVSGFEPPSYNWYPSIAFNTEGKAMVTWMFSQERSYYSRLYDPETEKWEEVTKIAAGTTKPWPLMYSKVVSGGSDFYWVGMDGSRVVVLYKYVPEHNNWVFVTKISNVGTNWVSAHVSGRDLYVTWDSFTQPTACYLTTVSNLFPPPPIEVKSVINLVVERMFERSFFGGYRFNTLTWEANPLNEEQGIVIAAHHVYRKERTADSSQWTQISVLGADVFTFLDNNVPSGIDYVYAVTCVDSNGKESPIEEPTGQAAKAASFPKTLAPAIPSNRR
jgi:hypothetical protein